MLDRYGNLEGPFRRSPLPWLPWSFLVSVTHSAETDGPWFVTRRRMTGRVALVTFNESPPLWKLRPSPPRVRATISGLQLSSADS